EEHEQMHACYRLFHVVRRRRDDDRSACSSTAELGQRRGVDAYPFAAELRVRIPGPAAADSSAYGLTGSQDSAAERQRAGDDAAASVDDLDEQLRSAEGRVEGPGSRE